MKKTKKEAASSGKLEKNKSGVGRRNPRISKWKGLIRRSTAAEKLGSM